MAIHKDLPDSELHEPKHIQAATVPGDAGKVIVAKGDGTSELRKLVRTDFTDIDADLQALEDLADQLTGGTGAGLSGAYLDTAASTGTVDVTVEEKQFYFIGPLSGQTVSVQLPDPSTAGTLVVVKRLSDQGTLKVIPFAAELVEGGGELSLLINNNAINLVSDGTDWRVV